MAASSPTVSASGDVLVPAGAPGPGCGAGAKGFGGAGGFVGGAGGGGGACTKEKDRKSMKSRACGMRAISSMYASRLSNTLSRTQDFTFFL